MTSTRGAVLSNGIADEERRLARRASLSSTVRRYHPADRHDRPRARSVTHLGRARLTDTAERAVTPRWPAAFPAALPTPMIGRDR